MKANYFDTNSKRKSIYQTSSSYISSDFLPQKTFRYVALPEEYSIFSEIEHAYFVLDDTDQHSLLASVLQYMKENLMSLYMKCGIICALPKLNISFENDGAIVLNWAYDKFRIFFNFEVLVDNSHFGIAVQLDDKTMSTATGKIDKENFKTIIDFLLHRVIETL